MDKKAMLEAVFSPWPQLTEQQKELLVSGTEAVHYEKGTNIHCGGNDCIGLLVLLGGMIRTYLLSEEGKEVTLYRLHAGEMSILSASCVMPAITFDVQIDAEEDTQVLLVSTSVLAQLVSESVFVECFLYQLAAVCFSNAMWAMQQILFMSFDKRLALFLLGEMNKTEGDLIQITHEQTAKYMGSAREVVTRMLNYFAGEGIVELSRGGIRVLDRRGLQKLAQESGQRKKGLRNGGK
ncbi:MAG: Crp/Fnr family transcriptional regulator [Oscillospiraceae bacterium]|jgi:CRP/FNR family transcriptional regulator